MNTFRAATTFLFILFFYAFSVVLSSPNWSLYKVTKFGERNVYEYVGIPEDNTSAGLMALINVPDLVETYSKPVTGEILLIKNFGVTASKKKSNGKKATLGISSDAIQERLNSLFEDYTAAYFVKNFPHFVENYFNRLFGTPTNFNEEIADSIIFDRVEAIKISFIEKNKFIIYNYLKFDIETEDPFREKLLGFSTKLSSFSDSAVPDLVIKSHQGFLSLIDILKKRESSNSVETSDKSNSKANPNAAGSKKKGKDTAISMPKINEAEAEANMAQLLAEEEATRIKNMEAAAKLKEENDKKLLAKNQQRLADKKKKEELKEENERKKIEARKEQSKRDKAKRDADLEKQRLKDLKIAEENKIKLEKKRENLLAKEREEEKSADNLAQENLKEKAAADKLAKETARKELVAKAAADKLAKETALKELAKAAAAEEEKRFKAIEDARLAEEQRAKDKKLAEEQRAKDTRLAKERAKDAKLTKELARATKLAEERDKATKLAEERDKAAILAKELAKAAEAEAQELRAKLEALTKEVHEMKEKEKEKEKENSKISSDSSISSFGTASEESYNYESRNSPQNANIDNLLQYHRLNINPTAELSYNAALNANVYGKGPQVPQDAGFSRFSSGPNFDLSAPASRQSSIGTNSIGSQRISQFSPASFSTDRNYGSPSPIGHSPALNTVNGPSSLNTQSAYTSYPRPAKVSVSQQPAEYSLFGSSPDFFDQGLQSNSFGRSENPQSAGFSLFGSSPAVFGPAVLNAPVSGQNLQPNSLGNQGFPNQFSVPAPVSGQNLQSNSLVNQGFPNQFSVPAPVSGQNLQSNSLVNQGFPNQFSVPAPVSGQNLQSNSLGNQGFPVSRQNLQSNSLRNQRSQGFPNQFSVPGRPNPRNAANGATSSNNYPYHQF